MAGVHMIHTAGSCRPREMTFCRKIDIKKEKIRDSNLTIATDRLQTTAVIFSSKIWMDAFYGFERKGGCQ